MKCPDSRAGKKRVVISPKTLLASKESSAEQLRRVEAAEAASAAASSRFSSKKLEIKGLEVGLSQARLKTFQSLRRQMICSNFSTSGPA